MSVIKIAVLGFGIVGSGTVELFYRNRESICKKAGKELDIKYILEIRDMSDTEYTDKQTTDINDILDDDEVTIVAELIGGIKPAYSFVKSCLERGKSVVTSNKELVAEKGAELIKTAKQNNCCFYFEASAGGAIPLIRPLHQCLAGNEITSVAGILNGTTNFILTKMINDRMDFNSALKLAQELGYSEKDPVADIEGHDACRKICIIASLVFGRHVYPEYVHCEGIAKITAEDAAYAENWGGAIKLIGSVKKTSSGKILPLVRPAFVCGGNQLSNINDVFNGIMVYGDAVDEVMFYGRGAGKMPTASAVMSDIIDAAKSNGIPPVSLTWEDTADSSHIADYKDDITSFYVRTSKVSKQQIINTFGDVEFLSRNDMPADENAFITKPITERKFDVKLERFSRKILSSIRVFEQIEI